MDNKWFRDERKFGVLTDLIRETYEGGVLLESTADESNIEILEEAINEGLAKKDRIYECPQCGEIHLCDYLEDTCSCGYDLPNQETVTPDSVQYYQTAYPGEFKDTIGSDLGEFEVRYRDIHLEDVKVGDLHRLSESTTWFLNISPFIDSNTGLYPFPGYADVFLGWERVPKLVTDTETILEQIKSTLETDDTGPLAADGSGVDPTGPNEDVVRGTPWFTMQRDTSPTIAEKRSQERFDISYNKLFEKLSMEFLDTLFPYAVRLEGGQVGIPEPDGYLHIQKEGSKMTYLIESKCYSRDFKIFQESDKNTRYISKFKRDIEPQTDFNLVGCIFIANRWKEDRTEADIADLVHRNLGHQNLNIIAINDQMMAQTVSELREVSRRNPSAEYRIYDNSCWYYDLLDGLNDYTNLYGPDPEHFKEEFLQWVVKAGEESSKREETIRDLFCRSSGFGAMKERVAD